MNARVSSLFTILVVIGLLMSACSPAATPAPAQAPAAPAQPPQFQPPTSGNQACASGSTRRATYTSRCANKRSRQRS